MSCHCGAKSTPSAVDLTMLDFEVRNIRWQLLPMFKIFTKERCGIESDF